MEREGGVDSPQPSPVEKEGDMAQPFWPQRGKEDTAWPHRGRGGHTLALTGCTGIGVKRFGVGGGWPH